MRFTTYAQNFEDVLLWRALGHVKDGFYIDVGANDPIEHSVTRAFYERGWSGISIEPLPAFHEAFLEQRPRDTNLAIAAGAENGELTLYDVPDVRGWASPEREVAELHRAGGHAIAELTVPVRTLASVCEEHVKGEIHFLKIDVEGFEGEVLRGMDFERWRPWVLVIEATLPNSRVTAHEQWEHLVTGHRYSFAWFDGLNRYYVADEHAELMAAFGVQPNVFDDFISHHLVMAWDANKVVTKKLRESEARLAVATMEAHDAHERANMLQYDVDQMRMQLAEAQAANQQVTAWAKNLEDRLLATLNSTSWKITAPLRRAGALGNALRRPGLARRVLGRVTRNERLRRAIIPVLLRYPALGKRVNAALSAIKQAAPEPLVPGAAAVPEELRGLPASVRTVLADLKRARGSNQTGK